jgi:hypothetical protein
MPRTQWNLESHTLAHGQRDDDVKQQREQNENVDPLRMPAEFFGKGIGIGGPAALDAIRRQKAPWLAIIGLPEAQPPNGMTVLNEAISAPAFGNAVR